MRALISVSDKTNLENFARALKSLGFEIISTGGTYKYLTERGIDAIRVEDITKFPEILGGRVKTLHPKIHGAILARREEELKPLGIEPIDMVVVNLYPFEKFVNSSEEELIENIDIGGVALLRAAAKNYHRVMVVSSPQQYDEVVERLKNNRDDIEFRRKLAMEAFATTARYDALIYNTLWHRYRNDLPEYLLIGEKISMKLRYGENPHQRGAYYTSASPFVQHHGKELSFNNLYDMDSAYSLAMEFDEPASVVVKHANPCGAATGKDIVDAFLKAWDGDPVSAYGSIVAFNRRVNMSLAEKLVKKFIEVIVAPSYDEEALRFLKMKKKSTRLIEMKSYKRRRYNVRQLTFGYLLQDWDEKKIEGYRVVTKRVPSESELEDLLFAWKVVRYVRSNAIVFAKDGMVVGVGAGQMSRVDSVKIAAMKAGDRAKNAVMASDAFFPFPDGIEVAYNAGITAVIQPGGSIRDEEVIKAADERDMAMIFTGYRVFKH